MSRNEEMTTLQHFSSLICVRRNHLFSAPLPSCGSTDPLFTPTPIFLGKLMFPQPETTSFIRTNLHLALSWYFPEQTASCTRCRIWRSLVDKKEELVMMVTLQEREGRRKTAQGRGTRVTWVLCGRLYETQRPLHDKMPLDPQNSPTPDEKTKGHSS